jgi:hypothetical protein
VIDKASAKIKLKGNTVRRPLPFFESGKNSFSGSHNVILKNKRIKEPQPDQCPGAALA